MVLCLLAYAAAVLAAVYYAVTTIAGKFQISGASRKAVLITGCDTGFGRLAALKCLREGMVVFAGCLHEKSVKELEDFASEAGGKLVPFVLDVTSDDSVASAKQLVENRVSKHSGLHAVINNAGTAKIGFNDWIDVEDYKAMMDVDLFGTVRVNQAFFPLLKKSRGGRIVNVSAFLGRFAFPGFGPYNSAKYAIAGYTDTLRRELAPFGIRVIMMHPGWHRTPMGSPANITAAFEQAWKKADPEVREEYGEQYIKELCNFTAGYLRSSCNTPQTDAVTEAYYHAITSVWPKKSYLVGPLALYVSLVSVLPDFVQDYAWDVVASAVRHPKPALAALRPVELPIVSEQQASNELARSVSDVCSTPEIWPIYEQEYKRPCTKALGTASIDKPSRKKEKAGTLPRPPKPRQRVRRQSLFSVI